MAASFTRTTKSTLSLFNLLRRSSLSPPPTLSRSITTTTPKRDTQYDIAAAQHRDDLLYRNNPFRPPCPPCECISTGEFMCARIDMPGIGEEDCKVWVHKNSVFFEAKGTKGSKHDGDGGGREYGGSLGLVPDASYFKTGEMVSEVKDGVLRITMPHNPVTQTK